MLSDRVQSYLPEFEGEHKDKAKVWHLLSHTSGLPDQLPENTELRRAHAPLSRFVAGALRKTPLLYEPGKGLHGYQSMGTLLAGEIVGTGDGPAAEGLSAGRALPAAGPDPDNARIGKVKSRADRNLPDRSRDRRPAKLGTRTPPTGGTSATPGEACAARPATWPFCCRPSSMAAPTDRRGCFLQRRWRP